MIDLRSDTFTTPDQGMRDAMAGAAVGDDVYSEDPTVTTLQNRIAAMFGKEAALFVPSGTMGNQICLAIHCNAGTEVIAEADAHVFHYENGAASALARVQIHCIPSTDGAMSLDSVAHAVRPKAYYYPTTALIAVENTHNRHGGTVLPLDYLRELRNLASQEGIAMHCDGARIWNACIATGSSHAEMAAPFDTVNVCLSKGLGAPVGSVIVGTQGHIDKAIRWRKMLGGGMRQVGILAAGALYALDHVLPLLPADHRRAKAFADGLTSIPGVNVETWRVQTNMVRFNVPVNDSVFVQSMRNHGVAIAPISKGLMRAVFYHQISDSDTAAAIEAVSSVLKKCS